MSRHSWLLPTLALPLALSCHAYRPVTANRPALPESRVRIEFAVPVDVPIRRDGADELILRQVAVLEGYVMSMYADTLRLDVRHALDANGYELRRAPDSRTDLSGDASDEGPGGSIDEAVIVPDANTRLAVRQFSTPQTAGLTLGLVVLALATAVTVAVLTYNPKNKD